VLEQFNPAPGTTDVNSKLRAFARGISTGVGGGKGAFSPPPLGWARAPAPTGVAPQTPIRPVSVPQSANLSADEVAFVARWGLGGFFGVKEILHNLTPEVRSRVMREFAPAPGTRDIFRLFAGFANSVSRTASAENSAPPLRPPRPLVTSTLPVRPVTSGTVGPVPLAPTLHSGGVAGVRAGVSCTPEEFAERWQLDEGSTALLRGLPEDIKAVVMAAFNPRGPLRDIGGKFCAFARSVAARAKDGGLHRGVKRFADWTPEAPGAPAVRWGVQ